MAVLLPQPVHPAQPERLLHTVSLRGHGPGSFTPAKELNHIDELENDISDIMHSVPEIGIRPWPGFLSITVYSISLQNFCPDICF